MLLETLDDVFQNSEEYVNANFAMRRLGRRRCFMKEWEESRPSANGYLNTRDSGNNTGCGMANKGTQGNARSTTSIGR